MPIGYKQGNLMDAGCRPLGVVVEDNDLTRMFQRYLLQRAQSVFKWELPKGWDRDYFLDTLYVHGIVGVVYTPQFGVIPQECTTWGYNIYKRPTQILVANPVLGSFDRRIGVDCELFKMTTDYWGIMDIVNYYAQQMALTAECYACNNVTSKLAYVFAAQDNSMGQTMKRAADEILSGKPYTVVGANLFDKQGHLRMEMFSQNLKANYIAPDILVNLQKLVNMFDSTIGIPNANIDKKERQIVDEVNSNNVGTMSMVDMWFSGWEKTCKNIKNMFGVDVSVKWRVEPDVDRGVNENAELDNVGDGSV